MDHGSDNDGCEVMLHQWSLLTITISYFRSQLVYNLSNEKISDNDLMWCFNISGCPARDHNTTKGIGKKNETVLCSGHGACVVYSSVV
jgi:hypothetical protein